MPGAVRLDLGVGQFERRQRFGADEVVEWLTIRQTLGLSAFQLGVVARALQMTAEYAREREQFDRPIGSFQAVAQRLADGYIDVKGLRLTLTQAAWRLDPSPAIGPDEVRVRVRRLNLDAASFTQLRDKHAGDGDAVRAEVIALTARFPVP